MAFEKHYKAFRGYKEAEEFPFNENVLEISRISPWNATTGQQHNLPP